MAVASTSMSRKYSVYGLGESGRPQEDTVGELPFKNMIGRN